MALVDARGFTLTPDTTLGASRGLAVRGQFDQQRQQREQALLQQQQAQAQLAQQARLQGIIGRLGGGAQPQAAAPAQLGQQAPGATAQPLPQLGAAQPAAAPLPTLGQQAPGTTAQPQPALQPQRLNAAFGDPQAMAQLVVEFPEVFDQVNQNLGVISQQQKNEAADFSFKARNTPFGPRRDALIDQREALLTSQGRNAADTQSLRGLPEEDQNQSLDIAQIAALDPEKRQDIARGESLTAAQREFAGLTEGLTPGQKQEAKLIELGLSPRAVGSAIQTISDKGIAEEIGDVEATIKERAKFGELTGSSRARAIDSGFERIGKITQNISNLDRAIAAVEAGAGTGAIEKRFPSIRAAAVELDQIQGELALDVIGAVTFGALSEGELNLAKQIALPTGLDGPQLIQHLQDRKAAQEKLRGYFSEQVNFLDQGGSVAGFLRDKERQGQQAPQAATQPAQAQAQQAQGVIRFDRTGKRI